MVDYINKNNHIILFLLIITLGLLIILKEILLKTSKKTSVKFSGKSMIGKREIKEVNSEVITSGDMTLAILADGLGKNEAGKISSDIAIKTFKELFNKQAEIDKVDYFFRKAFMKTNSEIIKRIDNNQGGTSAVTIIIKEGFLYYGSVGDSIIGVFRNGELIKINDGHTINVLAKKAFYEGNIDKESALKALKQKKLIYYLGQEGFEDIEMFKTPIKLHSGDIVVLMNRGLYRGVSWITLEKIINEKNSLNCMCDNMMQTLKEKSYHKENSGSVVLMKYR